MTTAIENIIEAKETAAVAAWVTVRSVLLGEERKPAETTKAIAALGLGDEDLVDMGQTAAAHRALGDPAAVFAAAVRRSLETATASVRFDTETEQMVATLRAERAIKADRLAIAAREASEAVTKAGPIDVERCRLEVEHPYVFYDEVPPPVTRELRRWYRAEAEKIAKNQDVDVPAGLSTAFYRRCVERVALRLRGTGAERE